jgi:hypothetical protein
MNDYPADWKEIATSVKEEAGWQCVRCGHPHESPKERIPCDDQCDLSRHVEIAGIYAIAKVSQKEFKRDTIVARPMDINDFRDPDGLWYRQRQRVLTVHHLDGDKANVQWWNLAALCQVCHLQIQGKVTMEQHYYLEHSRWFKPYVAGYYAWKYLGEGLTRSETEDRMDELLALELAAEQT